MNIEAGCGNCGFCKGMTGPHDTDDCYVCMRGSPVLAVKPEGKCAHMVEGFEPIESLSRGLLDNQLGNIMYYGWL